MALPRIFLIAILSGSFTDTKLTYSNAVSGRIHLDGKIAFGFVNPTDS